MSRESKAILLILTIFSLGYSNVLFSPIISTNAQNPITFSEPVVISNFPDSLSFQITVTSTASHITEAEFILNEFADGCPDCEQQYLIEVKPAEEVTLTYTWDTNTIDIYPWMPVAYSWQVSDSNGNTAQTETALAYYEDSRFSWQTLEEYPNKVYWHNQEEELFGENILNTTTNAIIEQSKFFGLELTHPIQVIIYNQPDEYTVWTKTALFHTSNRTYPKNTLIVTVSRETHNEPGVALLIPHDLAHIFFYQYLEDNFDTVPVWLNEGLARYLEYRDKSLQLVNWAQDRVDWAQTIPEDQWVPLFELSSPDRLYSEDESSIIFYETYFAVLYIANVYGEQSILDLLDAYKQGMSTDEAFKTIFDMTPIEFDKAWLAWLQSEPKVDYFINGLPHKLAETINTILSLSCLLGIPLLLFVVNFSLKIYEEIRDSLINSWKKRHKKTPPGS